MAQGNAAKYGILRIWKMQRKITTPNPQEETLSVSRAKYEALQAENAELTQQVKWLMEQHIAKVACTYVTICTR
nr:hypothetical protein [Sporomusa silvacetica]